MANYSATIFAIMVIQILLAVAASSIIPFPVPPERDVSSMCAATTCLKGTFCRVAVACSQKECLPFATCVPCVPEGVDAICNANNYINTVLLVKLLQRRTSSKGFVPLLCNPTINNDDNVCPKGSVCAASDLSREIGTCCYGKPEPNPQPRRQTLIPTTTRLNNDSVCDEPSNLCGEKCPKWSECQPTRKECGELSYSCRPLFKAGRCPPIPFSPPGMCKVVRLGNQCDSDSDCNGDKKCCKTVCGGRACLSPF